MCKKNYFVIIITIIIFLCTFGCSQDPDDIEAEYVLSDMEMEEPNFSSETTHEAQLEETTKDSIPLDESELTNVINFDSEADLSLLGFYEQENIDCTIEDGMLIIAGRENQSGRVIVGLNEELYKHSVIHIKLMTYILPITSDFMPILQAKLQPQNLGLMCENLRPFDFLFYEGSWGMGVAYSYFDGTAELVNLGQWVDIILFLDEDGQTYRAILWESEDSSRIVCASIKLPQECVIDCFSLEFEVNTEALTYDADYRMCEGVSGIDRSRFDILPEIYIDYIYTASEPLESYLKKYVSGYESNKQLIDEFLSEPPADFEELVLK